MNPNIGTFFTWWPASGKLVPLSSKKIKPPVWFKNTYFWISGLLVIIAIAGLFSGEASIRDPGQKREGGLVLLYLAGAVIMFVNGIISHRQTIQAYDEFTGENKDGSV